MAVSFGDARYCMDAARARHSLHAETGRLPGQRVDEVSVRAWEYRALPKQPFDIEVVPALQPMTHAFLFLTLLGCAVVSDGLVAAALCGSP